MPILFLGTDQRSIRFHRRRDSWLPMRRGGGALVARDRRQFSHVSGNTMATPRPKWNDEERVRQRRLTIALLLVIFFLIGLNLVVLSARGSMPQVSQPSFPGRR
jgi:hypothetical protein